MLRYLKHRILVLIWLLRRPKKDLDFVARAFASVAVRWSGEIDPIMTYMGMFDSLRRDGFRGEFIEFGGGFSTILAQNFLKVSGKSITSIDFQPEKYFRILNSKSATSSFLSTIRNKPVISVSLKQVHESLELITKELSSYEPKDLNETLIRFGYTEVFSQDKIIEDFKGHEAYNAEVGFYQKFNAISNPQFCSHIVSSGLKFNGYFFDCGEVSSVAEFWIIMPTIDVGSYVLLHDILYPKSIKNFIVATFLSLSPNWEIIYLDLETPQGGLAAKRIS